MSKMTLRAMHFEYLSFESFASRIRFSLHRFDVRDERQGTLPMAEVVFTGASTVHNGRGELEVARIGGHVHRPSDERDMPVSPALLRLETWSNRNGEWKLRGGENWSGW